MPRFSHKPRPRVLIEINPGRGRAAWADKRPSETLSKIETRLAPKGQVLVTVDISRDCCTLMVLPARQADEASELARRAAYGRIVPARDA